MGAWCEAVTLTLKKQRNQRCKTKAAGSSQAAPCKQDKFFVTGEVYLLDIGLLMGTITLTLARVHITSGNMNYLFFNSQDCCIE